MLRGFFGIPASAASYALLLLYLLEPYSLLLLYLLECYALLASALLTRDPAEPVTASGPWRDRVRRPRLGASGAPCFVRRRGGFFRALVRVKDL